MNNPGEQHFKAFDQKLFFSDKPSIKFFTKTKNPNICKQGDGFCIELKQIIWTTEFKSKYFFPLKLQKNSFHSFKKPEHATQDIKVLLV